MKRTLLVAVLILALAAPVFASSRVLVITGRDKFGTTFQGTSAAATVMTTLEQYGHDIVVVSARDTVRIDAIRTNWGTITGGYDYQFDFTIFENVFALSWGTSYDSNSEIASNSEFPRLPLYTRRGHLKEWPGRCMVVVPYAVDAGGCWNESTIGLTSTTQISGTLTYDNIWLKWNSGDDSLRVAMPWQTFYYSKVLNGRDSSAVSWCKPLLWFDSPGTRNYPGRKWAIAWFTQGTTPSQGCYWVTMAAYPYLSWVIPAIIAGETTISKPLQWHFTLDFCGLPLTGNAAAWGNATYHDADTTSLCANYADLVRNVLVPYNLKCELLWNPRQVYDNTALRSLLYNLAMAYPTNVRLVVNASYGSWDAIPLDLLGRASGESIVDLQTRMNAYKAALNTYYPNLPGQETIYLYGGEYSYSWDLVDDITDFLYANGFRYALTPSIVSQKQIRATTEITGPRVMTTTTGSRIILVPHGPEMKYIVASGITDSPVGTQSDTVRVAYLGSKPSATTPPRAANVMHTAILNMFGGNDISQSVTYYSIPTRVSNNVWVPTGTVKLSASCFLTGGASGGTGDVYPAGTRSKYPEMDSTMSSAKLFFTTMGQMKEATQYISTTYGLKKSTPYACVFTSEFDIYPGKSRKY